MPLTWLYLKSLARFRLGGFKHRSILVLVCDLKIGPDIYITIFYSIIKPIKLSWRFYYYSTPSFYSIANKKNVWEKIRLEFKLILVSRNEICKKLQCVSLLSFWLSFKFVSKSIFTILGNMFVKILASELARGQIFYLSSFDTILGTINQANWITLWVLNLNYFARF